MRLKKEPIDKGIKFSVLAKEYGFSYRYIQGLVRKGEIKLNDYDRIDNESYFKFKQEWDSKPDWMKKK